jgi:hypothetical protein
VVEDDETIADDENIYRRIPPSQAPYNENRGRRWPSSASLMPSGDDAEVSVYLASELEVHRLTPHDCLEGHDNYGLVQFPARAARDAGYGLLRDPISGAERPLRVDPAHALMTGTPPTSKQRRRPARQLLDDKRLVVLRDPIGDI